MDILEKDYNNEFINPRIAIIAKSGPEKVGLLETY